MSVELRPPRRGDAPAIAEALTKFSRVADLDPESAADVESWLDTPSLDLDRDARVATAADTIVGYCDIADQARTGEIAWVDVRADPARPEAWEALLEFAEERARELAPTGEIRAWAPEKAGDWRRLLESRGYGVHHYSLRMQIGLEDEPPEPVWPNGIEVGSPRPGEEETVYEAHMDTFSDTRDFARQPFDQWRHWFLREPFEPDLWFTASAGDEIEGISLCRPEWGGDEDLGWVSVLGVRKPWRGLGLGRALLLHSFRELRNRGKRRAGLGVDAENPSAVRLYESAGMQVERRHIWYRRAVA